MAWADSKVSRQHIADALARTAAFDLSGAGVDTFKFALFTNAITPDKDAAAAAYAYNAGVWLTADEVYQVGQWAQGGVALTSPALTLPASGIVMFDADDVASGTAFTTPSATHGGLCYDDTLAAPVADQGVCHNYFGGGVSVSAGQLTVVFSPNGLYRGAV